MMDGALAGPAAANLCNHPPKSARRRARGGVLRRLLEAFVASPEWSADRDIERFIARHGGRITDDLEREMTRRLLVADWSPRG